MTFRDAVVADAKQYVELRKVVLSESEFMLREPGEYSPSIREAEADIARTLDRTNCRILVAELEEVLVGFLVASGSPLQRLQHSSVIFMAVLKSHWGQGIGREMLRETLIWANSVGLERLELSVSTSNVRAIKLYEQFGFKVEGTRQNAIVIDGRFEDDHIMGLLCNNTE